jgi:diguanylate cyclase (GGDEF)-like protein
VKNAKYSRKAMMNLPRFNKLINEKKVSRAQGASDALSFLIAACFCILWLCVTRSYATGASERWAKFADAVFQHYTQDQGLPQPIVTSLVEDGQGFLWVGTQGGLARWDGYRFRNYLPNAKVPGSIPDNFINVLHTDPAGELWIGTSTAGLVRYDHHNDKFVTYPAAPNGLSNPDVMSIADDGRGGLWIATETGLNHLDPKTGKIYVIRHNESDPSSLPDDRIYTVLHDHIGSVWVGTKNGLARRDLNSDKFDNIPLTSKDGEKLVIRSLFEDSKGRIWIGTSLNGAFVINAPGRKPQQVVELDSINSTFESDFVNCISESNSGEIWLGTYGEGITIINPLTNQTRRLRHDPKVSASLLHDQIWTMYVDHTGSMLIGDTGGLDRHVNSSKAILTAFGTINAESGTTATDIVSVFESNNGLIWLGYAGRGVGIIDPAGNPVINLRPDQNQPRTALPKGTVTAFASDDKTVYIGTDRGVYRTDLTGKGLSRVEIAGRDVVGAGNALLYDAGILWIGGGFDGLWAIAPNGGPQPVVTHLDKTQLTDPRVNVIIRGNNHDLWAGTANGLNRIDLLTGKVERIVSDETDPAAISPGYVSSLHIDLQGRLWVALLGGGINVLTDRDSKGKPRFKKISTDDGLPNNNIDKLLQDNQGKIWASSDDGIAVLDPGTFSIRSFHRAEGVAIPSYWVNSGVKTSLGEMVFGGTIGLTVIRPELLTEWRYRPPVVVTDAQIGGKPMTARDSVASPLLINPDANSLAVEFSALDYTAPERIRYAYRLDGFDNNWVDSDSTRRLASYTNLPPGKYTLRVRGSNRDGLWTEKTLNLPIQVLAAWYQTWLFRIVLAIVAVLLVALLVHARTAYLRKAKQELEELVARRTRELSKSTEELRQSKLQLEEIAFLDALTGLPNRRLFAERFENFRAVSERSKNKFALLLIDLDKFKTINDTFGHDAGDAVLIATTERLLSATRAVDVVARLGGDEFAILLDGSEPRMSIDAVCERLMVMCEQPITFKDQQFIVSMSIGAAIYVLHGSLQAELYKAADIALYEAKDSGRNTWRCSSKVAEI